MHSCMMFSAIEPDRSVGSCDTSDTCWCSSKWSISATDVPFSRTLPACCRVPSSESWGCRESWGRRESWGCREPWALHKIGGRPDFVCVCALGTIKWNTTGGGFGAGLQPKFCCPPAVRRNVPADGSTWTFPCRWAYVVKYVTNLANTQANTLSKRKLSLPQYLKVSSPKVSSPKGVIT
jgi:hypothetical protein